MIGIFYKRKKKNNVQQLHSPDGEKRGGADAVILLAPLVMQVVVRNINKTLFSENGEYCIVDSYENILKISRSTSQAFEQFRKFQDVYGDSFYKLAKELSAKEKLLKDSIAPFYQSYQDIFTFLQPEIDKLRELNLSSPSLDILTEANSSLSSLFAKQNNFEIIIERTRDLNRHWQNIVASCKGISNELNTGRLALQSHFDEIAQISLLAQGRLMRTPWVNLKNNVFSKIKEFPLAVDSFNEFTGSYKSLLQSFNKKENQIVTFPPFVSGLPPIEVLAGADLLDTLARTEKGTDQRIEKADDLETEVRKNIETSLEELLEYVNPKIKRLWQGAKQAFISDNPDKSRHVVISLREMLTQVLHAIAPDSEVRKWSSNPSHLHEGRPTRQARLLYVCRDINHDPFEQFMDRDVKSHLKFIELFQKGTHGLNINFTEQQLKTLLIRTESLVRFLLLTWEYNK